MILLDTNVVSELRKVRLGRADPKVSRWAETLDATELFVSAITVHELEIGVLLAERRNPQQGAMFRAWLESHVLPAFAGRILPVDAAVARRSARMHVPDPGPVNEALILATAQVHGLAVATRNAAGFAPAGVPVIDPWEDPGERRWGRR